MSKDWKILDANPAAEKYFGKKLSEILNKNYIHTFVPEALRKKCESVLIKILSESKDTKFKMQLLTAEEKIIEADWSVTVLLDNNKVPSSIILSI